MAPPRVDNLSLATSNAWVGQKSKRDKKRERVEKFSRETLSPHVFRLPSPRAPPPLTCRRLAAAAVPQIHTSPEASVQSPGGPDWIPPSPPAATSVGERCRKLKFFLRFHQDPSMSSSKQRVKGVSLHLHTTCRSRAEACKGMVMMESYST